MNVPVRTSQNIHGQLKRCFASLVLNRNPRITPDKPYTVPLPDVSQAQERVTIAKTRDSLAAVHSSFSNVLDSLAAQEAGSSTSGAKDAGKKKRKRKVKDGNNNNEGLPEEVGDGPIRYSRRVEGLIEHDEGARLQDLEPPSEQRPIATLSHGLDRVLFNPGVHWLRDPRSRVYNFNPYLEDIPKVPEFAFERLPGFIPSSQDTDLQTIAEKESCTFAGSTSSLTGILSHIYFLISGNKATNTSSLSQAFRKEASDFTPGQRMPVSVVLNFKKGVYTIDSNKEDDDRESNILLWMGTLLEKFLTTPPEDFSSFLRVNPPPPSEANSTMREAYRYARSRKIVMRSQLDCHDTRLPGTGVFDIKTRACLPLRMDRLNFQENSGYLIRTQYGLVESFEREYYDLIRSAFLKYSFQARIGNMDGVIVAYHNTAQMFGFQYIPLEEMDEALYGVGLPGFGETVFRKCVQLMEVLLSEISRCFPNQSVRCVIETGEGSAGDLTVWVQPEEWHGNEDERPIKELIVSSNTYLDNRPAKREQAILEPTKPWTIHWTITHLSGHEDDARERMRASKERQYRAYLLPSGVPLEEVENFWKSLNFSGKSSEEMTSIAVPAQENFEHAPSMIRFLRRLAREGREHTEKMKIEEAGRRKVVLGMVEELSDAEMKELMVTTSHDAASEGWWDSANDAPEDSSLVEAASNTLSGTSSAAEPPPWEGPSVPEDVSTTIEDDGALEGDDDDELDEDEYTEEEEEIAYMHTPNDSHLDSEQPYTKV